MSDARGAFESIQKAASFAARHHKFQKRSGPEATPYVAHPFRVCLTIRHLFGIEDTATLCAALLHDLIEDTGVDYDDILEGFGEEVAEVVAGMTKDMRLPEAEREEQYDRVIHEGSWRLKAVKLGDVYDNLSEAPAAKLPKTMTKAERAIACAEGEQRLDKAVACLRELLGGRSGGG